MLEMIDIWNGALNEFLKDELTPMVFTDYFESIKPISCNDNKFVLQVPSSMHKGVLETRYSVLIVNALQYITHKTYKIDFVVAKSNDPENISDEIAITETINELNYNLPKSNIKFNSNYTFDSFVIGANNRFAHAAAYAVAQSPAEKYNPLFIYGGVGLGKTHLMHAIAQHILHKDPTKRVVYITSERFTNEFIETLQTKTNIQFRNKYRNADVLLIDDIQFIAGKDETQNEFFHTFNDLHGANKQIILTSDRPPREIARLEERLKSRFGWGLICDIQPPDFETRVAILRQKALKENFSVNNEIIDFIAQNIDSNIRDLEGVLLKVKALSEFNSEPISINLIKENLKDLISFDDKQIPIDLIIKVVSNYYKVSIADILSSKRPKQIANTRQIGMYLSRELTDLSLPQIGDYFGGRDHSTVIHACDKIKKQLTEDVVLKKQIDDIINDIKNQNK